MATISKLDACCKLYSETDLVAMIDPDAAVQVLHHK